MSFRAQFERARNAWHTKTGTWIAIDFETWERDHQLVTEVGICVREWPEDGTLHAEEHHFILSENTKYTNSVFVKGNREVSLIHRNEVAVLSYMIQISVL